jgi:hypothetical protein
MSLKKDESNQERIQISLLPLALGLFLLVGEYFLLFSSPLVGED